MNKYNVAARLTTILQGARYGKKPYIAEESSSLVAYADFAQFCTRIYERHAEMITPKILTPKDFIELVMDHCTDGACL